MTKCSKTGCFWHAENSKNFHAEGKRLYLSAIATLTGTIIGAGILGIPYVIAKSGFWAGMLNILILGALILFVNLYLGEIILRTKGRHQLPGYAEKYLGKKGKILMVISSLIFLYGALTAYVLGEGEVLSFVFLGSTQFTLLFGLIFFIIMAVLVYFGLKTLERCEPIGLGIVSAIILLIFFFFLPKINWHNFSFMSSNPINWFMPYGVILFAFLALSALPEMREELAKNERMLKKAIIIGSVIPIILYILFTIAVYGFAGQATPEIATTALGKLPSALAIFTMFTAFFALGIALKEVFMFDFKIKHDKAFLLAMAPVLVLSLLIIIFNLLDFIKIISLIGSVAGGLAGILILLMLRKAKKEGERKPEYSIPLNWSLIIILAIIFVAGIVYQFVF
ncbi:MAG: amino acid permease [Candidatus Pacearchaeota archaeon]|nr:amino acid permease [Candidatus Pacearchaeota archaeon]